MQEVKYLFFNVILSWHVTLVIYLRRIATLFLIHIYTALYFSLPRHRQAILEPWQYTKVQTLSYKALLLIQQKIHSTNAHKVKYSIDTQFNKVGNYDNVLWLYALLMYLLSHFPFHCCYIQINFSSRIQNFLHPSIILASWRNSFQLRIGQNRLNKLT